MAIALKGSRRIFGAHLEARRPAGRRASAKAALEQHIKDEVDAAARERAVANLHYLDGAEADALLWIYHQPGCRARASMHHPGIQGLYRLDLLEVEGADAPPSDRMWRIPEHIVVHIHDRYGPPKADKGKGAPPWDDKNISDGS